MLILTTMLAVSLLRMALSMSALRYVNASKIPEKAQHTLHFYVQVSFATYHHKIDRMVTKMRGSLVSMIFSKTLRLSSTAVSDASAITLMSTDIERIATGLRDMHEVYSNFIEIAIALWLLARLLKIATVASTLVVIGKMTLVEKQGSTLISL